MCGITGIYYFSCDDVVSERVLSDMAAAIHHRGPDDEGYYVNGSVGLANLRLSIIDITGGHQPIFNEDGSICVVYNGEIYNYKELRSELISKGHTFVTNSDTEVLVHGYEEYGPELLHKLNGMFAFAIWDEKARRLFLARDRAGIKPLHYAITGGTFVFGSEIKAILASGLITPQPNPFAIVDYFIKCKFFDNKTFFQDVHTLPAGHFVIVSPEGVDIMEYWHWQLSDEYSYGQADAKIIERTREVIVEAVRSQLISDVPLGSYLSGGIDSSIVSICAAHSVGPGFPTFSAVFDVIGFSGDESPYQNQIAQSIQARNYRCVIVAEDLLSAIQELLYYIDQPQAGISLAPLIMARFTRHHVKVVLTGHGGDEVFAGYNNVRVGHFWDAIMLSSNKLEQAINFLRSWDLLKEYNSHTQILYNLLMFGYYQHSIVRSFLKEVYSCKVRNIFESDFANLIGDYSPLDRVFHLLDKRATRSTLNRMLYVDLELWLPQLLMLEDKVCMAASLEARVPLLDNQVLEFATQIPISMRTRYGLMKWLLKEAFKSDLPREVIEHRKTGYAHPMEQLFRGRLKGLVQDILFDGRLYRRGIVRKSYVERVWREHQSGQRDRHWEIWQLLNLELWYRTFIDNPIPSIARGGSFGPHH